MQELINELRNEGWSLIKGGFGREFITSAIEWICKTATQADNDKRLEAEFEENSLNGTKQIRKLRRLIWNDIIFWTDLFTRSGIFDLGRSLVPGDLAVIYHAAFLKPKIVGSAIEFHQDQALWSYDYPNAVN